MRPPNFETCALECLDSLLGYARHLARREDEAEDLVQEAYARVMAYRDRLADPREVRPLLFRIVHNLFVDQYRSQQRGPVMIPIDGGEPGGASLAERLSSGKNPLEEILTRSLSDEMECALRSLDEGLRATLCLREIEEFSYEEISEILEIPVGTVRSRLSRARRALARRLTELSRGAPEDAGAGPLPRGEPRIRGGSPHDAPTDPSLPATPCSRTSNPGSTARSTTRASPKPSKPICAIAPPAAPTSKRCACCAKVSAPSRGPPPPPRSMTRSNPH
jgi:RNA polymerase sigma-70 factor, ECF subfamily